MHAKVIMVFFFHANRRVTFPHFVLHISSTITKENKSFLQQN